MHDWDPQQYLQFKLERTRPAIDLVARIPMNDPKTVIDIGCGPGNSTQVLLDRWPRADVVGLDRSEKMIAQARRDYPLQRWIVGDASALDSRRTYDLVFSNAAIHWIPDHDRLLRLLFGILNANGVLAVQVPANRQSPLYRAIAKVGRSRRWKAFTKGRGPRPVYHGAGYYYGRLASYAREIAIWETIYYHILNSHRDLIDWYKSTAMKPYLDILPDEKSREAFAGDVLDACRDSYPLRPDGRILYPFRRLFFTARKP